MNDVLTWSLGLVRKQTQSMVRDLQPGQWCLQSSPGEHHAAWVVGHLLLADCYLLHLLDVEELPADFPDLLKAYGPGAVPTSAASAYPPHRVVSERLDRAGALRCDAVSRMTMEDLRRATPDAVLARAQPTLAHHLQALVFHEGHHGGQLAAWRQRQGLDPAPWAFAPDT